MLRTLEAPPFVVMGDDAEEGFSWLSRGTIAYGVPEDLTELHDAARAFVDDPGRGAEAGGRAREWALERFGLGRYQTDWDDLLAHWVG